MGHVTNGTIQSGATSDVTANVAWSINDLVLFSCQSTLGGTTGQLTISHPDIAAWAANAEVGVSTSRFVKSFWVKADSTSSGSPVTMSNPGALGQISYSVDVIPAAQTAATLVQAATSLSQTGINGGSSPQTFSQSYVTPTLASSLCIAIWGCDGAGGADSADPRASPAWGEAFEENGFISGLGTMVQVQYYFGADTASSSIFTAGGAGGAAKVASIIYEFAGVGGGGGIGALVAGLIEQGDI